ncbi:MAG: zinc ribbon domain-containing protein [Actinobacteria bacterium]|nr:zinc ribbon domain-containing protein [Actinomycetota bacterium]
MEDETIYCSNCGNPIIGGEYFCPVCGSVSVPYVPRLRELTDLPVEHPLKHIRSESIHNRAIISFVLSLVGALLGFLLLPLICSAVAIGMGSTTRKWINDYSIDDASGHTLSTIAFVLGIAGLVFWGAILIVALIIVGANWEEFGADEESNQQTYRYTMTPDMALYGHWEEKGGELEYFISGEYVGKVGLDNEKAEPVGLGQVRYEVLSVDMVDFTIVLRLDNDLQWDCSFSPDRNEVTVTQVATRGLPDRTVFVLAYIDNHKYPK